MGDIAPATTGLFRTVVEASCMRNNDEWVRYDGAPTAALPEHSRLRLVLSRPVYAAELAAGLSTENGSLLGRRDPDITLAVDAVWRIREEFPRLVEVFGDVHKVIAHRIAYDYYDCMSGGMPEYVVSLMRWACREFGVPGDTEVYPGPDRWRTVDDFLADTAGAPDIRVIDSAEEVSRHLLGGIL